MNCNLKLPLISHEPYATNSDTDFNFVCKVNTFFIFCFNAATNRGWISTFYISRPIHCLVKIQYINVNKGSEVKRRAGGSTVIVVLKPYNDGVINFSFRVSSTSEVHDSAVLADILGKKLAVAYWNRWAVGIIMLLQEYSSASYRGPRSALTLSNSNSIYFIIIQKIQRSKK